MSALLDALFPPRCSACGRGGWPFCETCVAQLEPIIPPWCERCRRPLHESAAVCGDCPGDEIAGARAAFRFAGPARAAIHRLKFGGLRSVAEALSSAMFATNPPDVDAVTWVPLSRARLATRGFDQAKALAVPLSRKMRKPARSFLTRVEATGPQAQRTGAARRTALAGSFSIAPRASPPPRILLVDDVMTTGATALACAHALREGGAQSVWLATAARSFSALRGRGYTREKGSRLGLWLPGDPPR